MGGWSAEKPELWMEIDLPLKEGSPSSAVETLQLEISKAAFTWPINDKPVGSVMVPVGRRADGVAAPIHEILDRLRNKRKVRVYAKVSHLASSGVAPNRWPTQPFLLFDGYTAGNGYRRSETEAAYIFKVEHWVNDLDYASAISATSSPTNPSSLIFDSMMVQFADRSRGAEASGGFTGPSFASQFVDFGQISIDFWGLCIKPFFEGLSGLEEITNVPGILNEISLADLPGRNLAALSALRRFEPYGSISAPLRYVSGVSLPLDATRYDGQITSVERQISQMMSMETFQALSGTTLWEKLLQYAAEFMFAVVPLPDRALVVPLIPSLKFHWATIHSDEYDHAEWSSNSPRVLRGVGIYGNLPMQGGGSLADRNRIQADVNWGLLGIGGYFSPPGTNSGQVIFKKAPDWMMHCVRDHLSHMTSGASGQSRGTSMFPGFGSLAPAYSVPSVQATANTGLLRAYAETLYAYEVLRHRQQTVSGKLRFDIAPGSIVKVEGYGEKGLGANDKSGQNMYGMVMQVDVYVDAETPKAGTSFTIGHWRDELENDLPGTSIKRHPFWTNAWRGAPLIRLRDLP